MLCNLLAILKIENVPGAKCTGGKMLKERSDLGVNCWGGNAGAEILVNLMQHTKIY